MERSVIKEINKKNLDTYLKTRQYDALYWPVLFPVKTVTQLTFQTLIGSMGNRVAADVIAYDASSPLKSRKVIEKLYGEIPKISIARKMNEKDLLTYNQLSQLANPNEQAILDLVFDDIDFCVEGVQARIEWLALQGVSQGYITLSTSNNNGLVTEENISFGFESTAKKAASVVWDAADASTTKPITDFKTVAKAARDAGKKLEFAWMHPDAYDYFTASTEVKNFVKGYLGYSDSNNIPFMGVDQVNSALKAANLPQIIIVDQSVTIETKDGTQSSVNPWNWKFVTFSTSQRLGDMLIGPNADEFTSMPNAIKAQAGPVNVLKWAELNPVAEWTKGSANAFPSWPSIDSCFSLYIDSTSYPS